MRPKLGLITIIVVAIGALWAIDVFLARMESREMEIEARHDADAGARLLAAGRPNEAVDMLRKAHAIERDNNSYRLELAPALVAAGKLDEAQTMIADALESSPNDGEANLVEARLMVQRGDLDQAVAYYHRAIYGIWPQEPQAHRIRVRLELANLLASNKSSQQLLAELIPLETDAQHDIAVERQVAHLYVEAGSPARAVTAYHTLIAEDPDDGANYAGLGEAELALGNFRGAETAFRSGIQRGAPAQDRLGLAAELADIDPTPRGLSAAEKFERSQRVLKLARDSLSECPSGDAAKNLGAEADATLSLKIRGAPTDEMAERSLDLAQEIWHFHQESCGAPVHDESLNLLMGKLSR
jgi:tetratricopeptide (TPR) repeat protein